MDNDKSLGSRAISGLTWKFLEKILAQGMQIVVQIVLARLLMPEEYGLVGLLSIFISISDVFILQGLTTALIQKKDADERDFSSVFIANILASLCIYAMLFFLAPAVAVFYKEPRLTKIMRVLSLQVVIGALAAVHNAVLSRELAFKKSFFRSISNAATQGVVGIALACLGWGAWALVFSKLAGTLVGVIVLWGAVSWRPHCILDFGRVKSLFSYSSKILGSNLANTIFNNLHSLVIGRVYTAADVGYYQRGQQIPQVLMTTVDGSMTEVLYPTFSKVQDDIVRLKNMLRKSISVSMFFILPMLFGLASVARPLTQLLLTEKWLPSVPYMQLSCVVCMFWPLSHRGHALNALGKSNVTLKMNLIGKALTIIFILLFIQKGIFALMLGSICAAIINLMISSYYVQKIIGYSLKELAQDVLPSFGLSLLMAGVVSVVGMLPFHLLLVLILQVLTGVLVYFWGAWKLRFRAFSMVVEHERFPKKLKTFKCFQDLKEK